MSDLFEEEELIEVAEDFDEVDTGSIEVVTDGLDARRKLEHMLDERRLRNELEDLVDY